MYKLTYIKTWLGVIILLLGITACQRVIDVDIGNATPKLVIEANLTDVTGTQTVIVSRSVAYNSVNVFPSVSGATVNLTDGTTNKVYKFNESAIPGTYNLNGFRGKTLNQYTLSVAVEGKTYTAVSIMPFAVNLDSLTLSAQAFGATTVKTVAVNYRDPANLPNQYKFVMYVNGVEVKRIFTENDNLTDGRAVSSSLYQRDIDLKSGDRVDVEMQCIDNNMFSYWNNLSNQGGNTPQDSSTPANPPSNFFNDNVLGYFSAHTTQRKSIIIP